MVHVLTGDMFATTKMIVEMVLTKPAVVCNKHAIVKSAYICIIVADGLSYRFNSPQVVTMAYNGLICNRDSPCILVMFVWRLKVFNLIVKQVYQCHSHYRNDTTVTMN